MTMNNNNDYHNDHNNNFIKGRYIITWDEIVLLEKKANLSNSIPTIQSS